MPRTKTGCLTCRNRRKKCDERQGMCNNCDKTNVVCEWPSTEEQQQSTKKGTLVGHSSLTFKSSSLSYDQGFGHGMRQEQNPPLLYQTSSGLGGQHDNGIGTFVTPRGLSQIPFASAMSASELFNMPSKATDLPQDLSHPSLTPTPLPLLISNVETRVQQRLFHHFARKLSQVLTVSSTGYMPITAVFMQLACHDKTVMNSILCLSASHLLRLLGSSAEQDLIDEKKRLYDFALTAQVQRTELLIQSAISTNTPHLSQNPDMLVATSILLCLYETCEGTNTCHLHLNMAHQIIVSLSKAPERIQNSHAVKYIVLEINPFLLESFVYYNTMALVTLTSSKLDQYCVYQASTRTSPDLTMVGLPHDLIELFPRIAAIRDKAKVNKSIYKGDILEKGIAIWEDLNRWNSKSNSLPHYNIIAEFYQCSLLIWWVSITDPIRKSERQIQDTVRRTISAMSEVKDDIRACLLFPLFVVGSAAIRDEDRVVVETQFQKQREWSALGNVDLSFQIVKEIWVHGDAGSWDWMSMLEKHNIRFLLT